jgi:hypothetical protein
MPIVVPSWYDLSVPDDVIRFDEFRQTLERQVPQADEFPLLVVDASPDGHHDAVKAATLARYGIFVDSRRHAGLASQNLTGLNLALQYARWAGRTEGEKSDLARATDFTAIVGLLEAGAALVCLGRDAQAMATLPEEQRVMEQAMNVFGRSVYRLPHDPSCGPRFMGRLTMERLRQFDISRFPQWEWQIGLIMELMLAGQPVEQLLVDLRHPETLRRLEAGNPRYISKRKRQGAAMLRFMNEYADEIGLPIAP